MAKMSELDAALKALLEYSKGIQEIVRGIRALLTDDDAADYGEAPKDQREETAEAAKPAEPEKVYTLQDVRALLKAHGAERLPDIDPKEYPAMMKEAEDIGV